MSTFDFDTVFEFTRSVALLCEVETKTKPEEVRALCKAARGVVVRKRGWSGAYEAWLCLSSNMQFRITKWTEKVAEAVDTYVNESHSTLNSTFLFVWEPKSLSVDEWYAKRFMSLGVANVEDGPTGTILNTQTYSLKSV